MTGVAVRAATAGDTGAIAGLLSQMGYPSPPSEVDARLRHWRTDPRDTVLVADDGEVVGLVALSVSPLLGRDGFRGRVMAESHRGRGIGRLLMDAVADRARELDCIDLEVTSSRTRHAAQRFYAAQGFTDISDRKAHFLKPLDD